MGKKQVDQLIECPNCLSEVKTSVLGEEVSILCYGGIEHVFSRTEMSNERRLDSLGRWVESLTSRGKRD